MYCINPWRSGGEARRLRKIDEWGKAKAVRNKKTSWVERQEQTYGHVIRISVKGIITLVLLLLYFSYSSYLL